MTTPAESGPEDVVTPARSATVDGALLCGVHGELTERDIAMFREVIASAQQHAADNDTPEARQRRTLAAKRRAERQARYGL